MNKRDLTSPFYFTRTFFGKCPGVCLSGRRCQIFFHYIIPYFFCQVKRFFKFFSANFFSPLSSLCALALAPNFMRCQILINQLQTSYDCQILIAATSAANLSSCQILNQLQSLYIYISPFIITQILILIKLQKLSNFHAQILNVSNFDF